MRGFVRRASAVAACLLLAVGLWLTVPAFFFRANSKGPGNKKPQDTNSQNRPPWLTTEEGTLTIESIDMLNYYAAIKMLSDTESANRTARYTNGNGITLYAASTGSAEKPYGFSIISDIGYDNPLIGEDSERPEGGAAEPPSENAETVVYYQLNPNETFSVSRVIFFQIEIRNADGFLASKIGTGVADVVITENSLEPMITFKNGDRYYSCCENTLLDNGKLYSTHKYIDGFYIVKNLEQENYSFRVVYDRFNLEYESATAQGVVCEPYKNGGDRPDGEMSAVGNTWISDEVGAFTVRDLEEYFSRPS